MVCARAFAAVLLVVMFHSQVVAEVLKPATTNDLVTALEACCSTEIGVSCTGKAL